MPSEPAESDFRDKLKVPSYPTHESGGVVWTYMGPKDKMPGFRDFGTENLPREKWRASLLPPADELDAGDGRDDRHDASVLAARVEGAADIEDDGSDTPGVYNSGKLQWKFWAHDRAPRVEVVDTWHGWRAAGLRDDAERQHARAPLCLHLALHGRTGWWRLGRAGRRHADAPLPDSHRLAPR